MGCKLKVVQLARENIICVNPVSQNDQGVEADMTYANAAADQIAPVLKDGDVILESTSPVGATDDVQRRLNSMLPENVSVTAAYCPERVLPGEL